MATAQNETIGTERTFTDTPSGWADRWSVEINAAKEHRKKFDREGNETIKRFLDRREQKDHDGIRVNVYTANVQVQEAMLYGKTPKVDVTRRWNDSEDDGARVGGEMLERVENADIAKDGDTTAASIGYALSDYLRPGLGVCRVRYVAEFDETPEQEAQVDTDGNELAPGIPAGPSKKSESENVVTEYTHWRDYLWSPARTYHDFRWQAFASHLAREELTKIFGDKVGRRIPLKRGIGEDPSPGETDAAKADPWGRATIWEVHDKEHKCWWWWCEGMGRVFAPLDVQDQLAENGSLPDPLGLDNFWSNPIPMVSNLTTDAFMPRSDYALIQDLLRQIDDLATRIDRLTKAMRVAGVYDGSNGDIGRLVREATEAELIAVSNWAKFVEKGGVKGAIDWLPLEMIANVLQTLEQRLIGTKALVDEISGFSDIIRGEQQAGQTATTSAIEAKFASVRMQRKQDEVARFASDLARIKAEIIAKHFDDETIIQRSNVLRTTNRAMVQQGLAAIRDRYRDYRIEIKPESISLTDYAALKTERTEIIGALGSYFSSVTPLIQQSAAIGPGAIQAVMQFVITTAQYLVAGMRGASEVETAFDQFVAQVRKIAAQPPQPPQPDTKLQVAQVKAQADSTSARLQVVNSVVDAKAQQAKSQADIAKAGMDMEHAQVKHAFNMQSAEAKARADALQSVNAVTKPAGT